MERYRRQLPLLGKEGQEKLLRSKVAIMGVGGIGSFLSLQLAAAGVSLRLVDWDVVELSNLNRQILYTTGDLGKPKVYVAAERLKELNPEIEVEPVHEPITGWNVLDMVKGVDLVLDALDSIKARMVVNEACVKEGIPHTYAAIGDWFATYTFFEKVGEDPCLRCILRESDDRPPNVIGPVPAVIASISAIEAIKYLAGIGGTLRKELLIIDLKTMNFDRVKVFRNPNCPVCAKREFSYLGKGDGEVFSKGSSHYFFRVKAEPDAEVLEETEYYTRYKLGKALIVSYKSGGTLVKGVDLEEARLLLGF